MHLVAVDDAVLRGVTTPIMGFGAPLQRLIDEMTATLSSIDNAVGLAAPQVGISLALSIIIIDGQRTVLVNPVVLKQEGFRSLLEGCLSLPDSYQVMHSRFVRVSAQDETGSRRLIEARDTLLAQALEHEIDHLYGKLIDRGWNKIVTRS